MMPAAVRSSGVSTNDCSTTRPRTSALRCDDAVIEREHDRGGTITQAELGEDAADVALHRRLTQEQVFGDLDVGGALRHETQHVDFASGELRDRLLVGRTAVG